MSLEPILGAFPTYSLIRAIVDKVAKVEVNAPSSEQVAEVLAETERQENEMRRLEAQARVAQETAIAARIENAAEVQIEEFYEYAGEGKLGAHLDEKGLALGLSGAGKRVSKRVYRFSGNTAAAEGKGAVIMEADNN